ncbi:MAG: WecB/TagA/CpsF family glycosyltransferase [Oligoflexus sp.]
MGSKHSKKANDAASSQSQDERKCFYLGYAAIDGLTSQQAVERVLEMANTAGCQYVVTPNSDHIIQLEEDRLLQAVYRDADLVVADGMPIVWASRLLGQPLPERVTGADLLPQICAVAASRGLSIFLLGAPAGVSAQAANILMKRYPGLVITGTYSPPMGFENDQEECRQIVKMINESHAHIVFVGLGAPKQEYWMHRYRGELEIGVLLGVGAAIEFVAGVIPRAPVWMQKTGLEWLFRLLQEPKRLARRYLRDFKIFSIVWRQWLRGKKLQGSSHDGPS